LVRGRACGSAIAEGPVQHGPDIDRDREPDERDESEGEAAETTPIVLPLRYGARRPISEPERPDAGSLAPDPSSASPLREARRGDVVPLSRAIEPTISPRMTAIFGGLFGLASIASLVALLIQIFPVHDQRALASNAPAEAGPTERGGGSEKRTGPKKRERKIVPGPWRVAELKGKYRLVSGEMQRRSFIVALDEAGVPKAETYRILKAFEDVKKFDRTGKSDTFTVALDGTKKVIAFEYVESPLVVFQAKTGDDGLLRGEQLDMKVAEEEYAASFYIGKDFAESYRHVGLERGLDAEINRAFNGRTSVEAFEEGGVVKVVVVETTALGAFVDYARIKAIEYRPPDPAKEAIRAYWFEGREFRGYVDEKGRKPSVKGWRSPVPGAPVTSHFNPKRMHPVLKTVMPHNGTDFGAPSGTPIYAANRGTVTFVGMQGASGNLVLIEHPGGIQTGYAHLSKFAAGLKTGQKVGTRQLIGYVGSTGRSTGPHLHFSAKRDGKFFDPLELKLDSLHLMPVADKGAFLEQKAGLDRAIERLATPEPPPSEPEPIAVDESLPGDDASNAASDDDAPPDLNVDEAPAGPSPRRASPATNDDGDDLLGDDLTDIE
jgi:murein DD-endopeptidase MepM/ murein hydrolase activator NlpD